MWQLGLQNLDMENDLPESCMFPESFYWLTEEVQGFVFPDGNWFLNFVEVSLHGGQISDGFVGMSMVCLGGNFSRENHRIRIARWPKAPGNLTRLSWSFDKFYAGLGLPQGPFGKTNSNPLKVGQNGFLPISQSRNEVGKKKWVSDPFAQHFCTQNPLFTHFEPISGHSQKPILRPTLSGNQLFSKKGPEAALTQHKISFFQKIHDFA